jgi:type IV pilus assembly protein PilY1
LYVINAKTGDLIRDIVTPATCSSAPATNPCGLAHISAYVDSELDNTTDYVYGGDLYGNVWRFNLTDLTSSSSWSVAKFATLKDASGNFQPITSAPELSLIDNMRMVFIGTGQYLGAKDIPGATGANSSATTTQTIYGLRDSLTTLSDPLRGDLQQQTLSTSGTLRTLSNNQVNYGSTPSSDVGWYIDLPSTGERVIGDPIIALSTLVVTTNIPSSTKCNPGGSSWEYFINLKTGGLAENSTVTWSGTFLGDGLASRPTIVQLPSGKVISLTRLSDATTVKVDVPISSTSSTKKRISWREIMR